MPVSPPPPPSHYPGPRKLVWYRYHSYDIISITYKHYVNWIEFCIKASLTPNTQSLLCRWVRALHEPGRNFTKQNMTTLRPTSASEYSLYHHPICCHTQGLYFYCNARWHAWCNFSDCVEEMYVTRTLHRKHWSFGWILKPLPAVNAAVPVVHQFTVFCGEISICQKTWRKIRAVPELALLLKQNSLWRWDPTQRQEVTLFSLILCYCSGWWTKVYQV